MQITILDIYTKANKVSEGFIFPINNAVNKKALNKVGAFLFHLLKVFIPYTLTKYTNRKLNDNSIYNIDKKCAS